MKSMLSQKLKEGNIILFDDLFLDSHRTSPWASFLQQNFGIGGKEGSSALIVDHYNHDEEETEEEPKHVSHAGVPINLWVASGNIPRVDVVGEGFTNVYNIIRKEKPISIEHGRR